MLMNDISLKVEMNDISGKSNICSFKSHAKKQYFNFSRDTGWWTLVFSDHADEWKARSNDRLLCVIIKISWITHHQNHPWLPMHWEVPYRKIMHIGGCALIHISATRAEIWITTSITASITATSERLLWLCGRTCPTSCGICLVVTNLPLKPDQLLEVFILIERLWRTTGFFKEKGRNTAGGCQWSQH